MTIYKDSLDDWIPFVRKVAEEVDAKFPRKDWTSTYPGHGEHSAKGGYAVDFLISSKSLGDKIADYVWDNRVRLGVWYVIWNKRIISRTPGRGAWQTYTNPVASKRGTASGDHTNHVHVSFYTNGTYTPLVPPKPPVLTDYHVDPAKVSTTLAGLDRAGGPSSVVKTERAPGFWLRIAKIVTGPDGRKWAVTEYGTHYSLDYLAPGKPPAKPAG